MRKGDVYKNLWAKTELYFVYLQTVRAAKVAAVTGWGIALSKGKWQLHKAQYYVHSLKNPDHFRPVGHVDIDSIIIGSVLEEAYRAESETAE